MAPRRVLLLAIAAAMTRVMCACSGSTPLLPARAAQDELRRCDGPANEQDELQVLQAMTILKAEPKYHVDYCSGAGQVFGVKLVVAPPSDVSADHLASLLRCHSARALLGQVNPELPDDPTWLPGSLVDIDVKAEAEHFVITLNGMNVSDNIRIMHRATAFAALHGFRAQ
jgi:hypothetical protein